MAGFGRRRRAFHSLLGVPAGPNAKKAHSATSLDAAGFHRGVSMPDILTGPTRSMPSIVPSDVPAMSDDECLIRLARAVEEHDFGQLDEVARLIGRLAVTIE
jgi:hypothetical protein